MENEMLQETIESIERLQEFDTDSLAREDELGSKLSFAEAIQPANKLKNLYLRISINSLSDLPDSHLDKIKKQADSSFNKLNSIHEYDPNDQNHIQKRDSILKSISNAYDSSFNHLFPYITYGMSVSVDFQRLENEARAAIQSIKDETGKITGELQDTKKQAEDILEEVRDIAAEQGVTQQAKYFKDESEFHDGKADNWRKRTLGMAVALVSYSLGSIFFHKMTFLEPTNSLEAFQLVSSKVLVFIVLTYMLYLCAKNFLSHKHNSIINKHRQNALLTFTTLVDSAKSEEGKEIILTHAASCIYAPQETGYTKGGGNDVSNRSIVEWMPRIMSNIDGQ